MKFENDVKMYGIQTQDVEFAQQLGFENDVKMYGIQTNVYDCACGAGFENDVKMYGIQTRNNLQNHGNCLRMM